MVYEVKRDYEGMGRLRVSDVQWGGVLFLSLVAPKALGPRTASSSVVVHAEQGVQQQHPRAWWRCLGGWVGGVWYISKEGQHGRMERRDKKSLERERRRYQYADLPSPVPERERESNWR